MPKVEALAPRPVFDALAVPGALALRIRALSEDAAAGRGLIQSLRVLIDSERLPEIPVNPPLAVVDRPLNVTLNPGRHRVSVVARNDRGQERVESFEVIAQEPLDLSRPRGSTPGCSVTSDRAAGRVPDGIPAGVQGIKFAKSRTPATSAVS